jgi:hypothetical protein
MGINIVKLAKALAREEISDDDLMFEVDDDMVIYERVVKMSMNMPSNFMSTPDSHIEVGEEGFSDFEIGEDGFDSDNSLIFDANELGISYELESF